MRNNFLICILTCFCSFTTDASIFFTPNQGFRVYATSPNATFQIKFNVGNIAGTSISAVSAKINGVDYTATLLSGGQYQVTYTASSFGTFSVKGFVTYNNGQRDSTFQGSVKLISQSTCILNPWNGSASYTQNSYISHNNQIYKANYYASNADTPGVSGTWNHIGDCSSQNFPVFDCTYIPVWNSATTYSAGGTQVSHQGSIYTNAYWTQNNSPSLGGPWVCNGACLTVNQTPIVNIPYIDTTLISSALPLNFDLKAQMFDTDGFISYPELSIQNNVLSNLILNGSNYMKTWTVNAYGDYIFKASAYDDEVGYSLDSAIIRVRPSIPPVISAVYPYVNQKVTTLYYLNQDTMEIAVQVTDADGTIDSVFFILGNQTCLATAKGSNLYSYKWVPATYGTYTWTINAKDNSGGWSTAVIPFKLYNPSYDSTTWIKLPLQLQMNLNNLGKTFAFDSSITSVVIRNRSLCKTTINGNKIHILPYRTGRTGLRITTVNGMVYYVGLRINNCDGTPPSMPDYASMGFKSEDSYSNLDFWKDVDVDGTNKNMDVRYIYINDGPEGYNSWRDSTRHINFCKNSMKLGLIPFFVYYNIPDGGESFQTDLNHARDTAYMKAYFKDLNNFLRQCQNVMGEDLFGIVLEPDFLGYMQQLGVVNIGTNDPTMISTAVSLTHIAPNAGTIQTLVQRINKTISDRKTLGANIYFGWQINLWADGTNGGTRGVMRRTDPYDQGWTVGRQSVINAATNTVNYVINCGVTSNGANFISMDKYGEDAAAGGRGQNMLTPWWFNNDHWDNYMLYAKTVHDISNKDVVLWQLPVGHINNSIYKSEYTNSLFPPLPNVSQKWEDPSITYFFGDTFVVLNDTLKKTHLLKNFATDPKLDTLGGDTIIWGSHIDKFPLCGVTHAMFGAGVGNSTDAIGFPPSDNYYAIQKIQNYYDNELTYLSTAPFTASTLIYNNVNASIDLKSIHGASAQNYYGKGVNINGIFNPSLVEKGTHYISFVLKIGNCYQYRVQKIIVSDCVKLTALYDTVCEGTPYSFFGQNLIASGVYSHTLQTVTNCDSMIELHLIVREKIIHNITSSICRGGSYYFNGQYHTMQGIYKDTLLSVFGCDSIIILTLNIDSVVSSNISAMICNGRHYLFNGQNLTLEGIYKDTFVSVNGCDSFVTLILNVNNLLSTNITASICSGRSYYFNGQNLTRGGVYKDTFVSIGGCDSLVILTLEVLPPIAQKIITSKHLCNFESYFYRGKVYTSVGNFGDTLHNKYGCDSIIYILSLTKTITDTILQLSTDMTQLYTKEPFANHQWVECSPNGVHLLNGETRYWFKPSKSGLYGVIISKENCVDTTSCKSFIMPSSSIQKVDKSEIFLYPNPLQTDRVTIETSNIVRSILVEQYDVFGTKLQEKYYTQKAQIFFETKGNKGSYLIKVTLDEHAPIYFKVIK